MDAMTSEQLLFALVDVKADLVKMRYENEQWVGAYGLPPEVQAGPNTNFTILA